MHTWHQTRVGLAVFLVLEVGLIYGFASLAIDRGSLWYYLLTMLFVVGALQNLYKLIRKVFVVYL
jgi:hypothetical protein